MRASDLKPASTFAQQFGVKCLAYGPPGSGKTPLCNTAPRPILLTVEPGMLSMRGSTIPTWQAHTWPRIVEFFDWFLKSPEAKNYDTLCIDSVSQMAEIHLELMLTKHAHGLKAYGEMAEAINEKLNSLFFLREKHIYLIAKMADNGQRKTPYFPGKELNVKIPHMYDEVLYIGLARVPGVAGEVKAIRTKELSDVLARDRSGKLDELEYPDLAALFTKAMS